jgi:hypothetical protein
VKHNFLGCKSAAKGGFPLATKKLKGWAASPGKPAVTGGGSGVSSLVTYVV